MEPLLKYIAPKYWKDMDTLDDIRMMVLMHLYDKYDITLDSHDFQRNMLSRKDLREHIYNSTRNWVVPARIGMTYMGQNQNLFQDGHDIGRVSLTFHRDSNMVIHIPGYLTGQPGLVFDLGDDHCYISSPKDDVVTLYYHDDRFPDDLYSCLKRWFSRKMDLND